MVSFDHQSIEKKWQKIWEDQGLYRTDFESDKPKFYNLTMFPYPSAAALHVGHVYNYAGVDTFGRYKRMKGYNVFEPMGFDAFGIHAENFAMKIGEHPQVVVPRNIEHFRDNQMKRLGTMFDWSCELSTTDPEYYKWTQWVFLQMYKAGLVTRKTGMVDWCSSCKTVLANEQVIDGKCERCRTDVIQKDLPQWYFKITDYAEQLLKGLDTIDWPERTKALQKNWIGKSSGVEIDFEVDGSDQKIRCFTTRPDTLFGVTFLVVSPEHPILTHITTSDQQSTVDEYKEVVIQKNELERTDLNKDKTGVFTGGYVLHPFTGEKIPVWTADYVLMNYGTGAVMGVPAHDERDFEFTQKYDLPVIRVVSHDGDESTPQEKEAVNHEEGVAINSDFLNGLKTADAKKKIMDKIESKGIGIRTTSYRLHDWCISRQRYWGPPIPMVHCDHCENEEKKKNSILFLHGWEDNSTSGFLPWLQKMLDQKGYRVTVPDLPNTMEPIFDEWVNSLHGEENQSVLGHSMGGLVALKLAEKHHFERLVLVSPIIPLPEKDYLDRVTKDLSDKQRDIFTQFSNQTIDFDAVKHNVEEITFVFGMKDDWITEEVRVFYRTIFGDKSHFIYRDEYGHMSQSEGVEELPFLDELFENRFNANAGWHPVNSEDLPIKLPKLEKYEPDGSGKGPLSKVPEFLETTCPVCGGPATRESDVSDTFLDSAWYQLRYTSTNVHDKPFDPERTAKWQPVDRYTGGIEHATMHLLYFRFVTKVLHDLGHLPFDEPATSLRHQGLIIKDGAKMSKSRGNVVNPDEYIEKYGADAFRSYMLFIGPYEDGGQFNDTGIMGLSRFYSRLYRLFVSDEMPSGSGLSDVSLLHKTIKKVGEDIENLRFNTAIAALMEALTWIKDNKAQMSDDQWREVRDCYLRLVAPFGPHVTEELWEVSGHTESIHLAEFPEYDESLIVEEIVTIVVQVQGKVRYRFDTAVGTSSEELEKIALHEEAIKKWILGKEIKRIIVIPDKLVNIVLEKK